MEEAEEAMESKKPKELTAGVSPREGGKFAALMRMKAEEEEKEETQRKVEKEKIGYSDVEVDIDEDLGDVVHEDLIGHFSKKRKQAEMRKAREAEVDSDDEDNTLAPHEPLARPMVPKKKKAKRTPKKKKGKAPKEAPGAPKKPVDAGKIANFKVTTALGKNLLRTFKAATSTIKDPQNNVAMVRLTERLAAFCGDVVEAYVYNINIENRTVSCCCENDCYSLYPCLMKHEWYMPCDECRDMTCIPTTSEKEACMEAMPWEAVFGKDRDAWEEACVGMRLLSAEKNYQDLLREDAVKKACDLIRAEEKAALREVRRETEEFMGEW